MFIASGWSTLIQAGFQFFIEFVFSAPHTVATLNPTNVKFLWVQSLLLAILVNSLTTRVMAGFIPKEAKHVSYQITYSRAKALRLPSITSNIKWNTLFSWIPVPSFQGNKINSVGFRWPRM
jgi:hypothetical protein